MNHVWDHSEPPARYLVAAFTVREVELRLVMDWYVSVSFQSSTDLERDAGISRHAEVFKLVWGDLKDLKILRWFPYKESFELPTAERERRK